MKIAKAETGKSRSPHVARRTHNRRIAPDELALAPSGTFATPRRNFAFDVLVASVIICLVIAVWYLGDFHALQNADSIVHSLASLYHWDPFPWEQQQHGELLPLLVTLIHRPLLNLLALNFLDSLLFLLGMTVWARLLTRNTSLTECAIWTAFSLPVMLTRNAVFGHGSSYMVISASFAFAGLYACMLLASPPPARPLQAWFYGAGLTTLSFLAIYTFQGAAILVVVVTMRWLWRHLGLRRSHGRLHADLIWSRLVPMVSIGVALVAYKTIESQSPYTAHDYYSFRLTNIPVALQPLLVKWAAYDLANLLPLLLLALVWVCQRCTSNRRPRLLTDLVLATLGAGLVFAALDWTRLNNYEGRYLSYFTYLLVLQIIVLAVSVTRQGVRWLATWAARYAAGVRAHGRRLVLAVALGAGLHLNALMWNTYAPLPPLARLEAALGQQTSTLVSAQCDVIAGDYWKVWPAMLAVNDYYYRQHTLDPRTRGVRLAAGLAYRAWPTQDLWRTRLQWPNARVCAFVGDEANLQWTLNTYAPDVSLRLLETRAGVAIYEVPDSDRYGRVRLQPAPPGFIETLEFEFDRPVPGSGWGGPEQRPDGLTFSWTMAPEARFYIPLAADGDKAVQFRVALAATADILASLSLDVNGAPIALTASQDSAGARILRGVIPESVLAAEPAGARLAFRVNRVVSPISTGLNPADARELGVALDWLKIEPLPGGGGGAP